MDEQLLFNFANSIQIVLELAAGNVSAATTNMKTILCIIILGSVLGCGSGSAPNPKVETQRVESAQKMRAAFIRVNGDYEQLSSTEKDEFVKMFNGKESDAKQAWSFMKNQGVGSTPGPSQSASTTGS